MSDTVIGRGTIEVVADSTKLHAGIDDAKKSIKSLGDANKDASSKSSASIDRYIKRLEVQRATIGMSTRETELYKLSLRGATDAQLKAADATLKLTEAEEKSAKLGDQISDGLIAAAAAATVAGGAMLGLVISSINAADNLNDLSKSTGVTVEDLSGLALAAEKSGTDLEGVAASISKLSVNIANNGEKFRALGITAKDPLEAFKQLADVFVSITDPQQQAAVAAAALGASWKSAAPLLAEGGKNIGEMVVKGKQLSGITTEMAEEADKFNDSLVDMKTVASGLGTSLAKEILPGLNQVLNTVKRAYEESGKLSAVWTAMGALGAFVFTNEFDSASKQAKDLKEEIKDLEGSLTGFGRFFQASSSQGGRAERDEAIKKQIAAAKGQLAGLLNDMKPKAAPVVVETPEQKAAKDKAAKEAAARAARFLADQAKDGQRQAEALAKEKLASDIANIKMISSGTIGAIANSERVLEARRSAGLVSDKEYYEEKRKFIGLNATEEEAALQKEIDRYEQEKVTGAARLANLRLIADLQSKIAKTRADSATDTLISETQEAATAKKLRAEITKSVIDEETAAAAQRAVNVESIRASLMSEAEAENEAYGKRLSDLVAYGAANLDKTEEINEAIRLETERHNKWMADARQASSDKILDITDNAAGELYNALAAAGHKETALAKAAFLVQKAIAVSRIITSTQVGAAAALEFGPVAGPILYGLISGMGYAAAGIVAGTAIAEVSGGRADGGPVSAGKLYEVNERGPELLSTGGRDYLMMGSQGGNVTSHEKMGGSGAITIINQTSAKIGTVQEQRLSNGERALIIKEAVKATAAQFSDPNSDTSRALGRNYSAPRSRG